MGGKTRICEICGRRERHNPGFFASFPTDEQRCRLWVQIVGNEDLVHIPIEKLCAGRYVCGDHFIKNDFNKKGNRLRKRALPKLQLLRPQLNDYQLQGFPAHVASKSAPVPVCSMDVTAVEPVAGTSKTPITTATTQTMLTPVPVCSMDVTAVEPVAGTSKTPITTATTQTMLTPAPVSSMEVQVASTSRTPLSTATTQNVIVPASSCTLEMTAAEPKMLSGSTPLASSTPQHMMDVDNVQAKLLDELKHLKSTIRSLKRNAKLLERLESPMVKEIVASALRNQKRKPKGRRWTAKYKISCLAILKRSPKAYRYLRHLVPLPSVKTLQNILRRIPLETGISKPVLEHLRKIAASYGDDKYCCLLFDEMAIKPRLNFNKGMDEVDGFTDLGNSERTKSLADHALVFMLQGIKKKYKQPLAFYFVKGTISSSKLATIIKTIIEAVNAAGFKIVATVCDQGPTNLGALKILKESSTAEYCPQIQNYFLYKEDKIYIIFDVPHLFKSIRNNFLNHGIIKMNGKKAKWEHLRKVEEKNRNLLYLSKVSENHTAPKYRAKMKVKYAAQILSNTVAAVLKLLALAETDPQESQELMESGELIQDLDRLFDFTNGPSGPKDVKKGQRENVSNKTKHIQEWTEYRKKLETLTFQNNDGKSSKAKCIQGYLTTLCSFRDLWGDLQRLGFKYLNLRQLNQDALENFFGLLRQHSPTNRNPTVSMFVAALKTSVVSGMTAPHSRGSNCEEDSNELLTNLQNFVFGDSKTQPSDETTEDEREETHESQQDKENSIMETGAVLSIPEEDDEIESSLLNLEGQAIVYVSGYIAMRISRSSECHTCKNSLSTANPGNDPTFSYIHLREWWTDRDHLTYPTVGLCKYVEKCVNIFESEVIPALHRDNISVFATTLFMASHDASFIACDLHRCTVFQAISSRTAIVLIRRQCQRINAKISAQEEELADKTKKAQQQGIAK